MKNFLFIVLMMFLLNGFAYAKQYGSSVYRTIQPMSYRNNYNRQVNNRPMPYWQSQSNYATRNKYYTNYHNLNNYDNSLHQYNFNTRMIRSSYH